jgi:[acyl-carrier-protein] S-malonyltransferase
VAKFSQSGEVKKVCKMNKKVIFQFPGQGSQAVGMGGALAAAYPQAKQVFDEVNEALGEDLFAIMANGPDDDIRLTRNAQPALFATSMAALAVLCAETGKSVAEMASFTAGHSLGEYAALAAAGSLSISDAARLLRLRGDAMQNAVPVGAGAMAAVLGAEEHVIEEIVAAARDVGVVQLANDNAPGQIVISGAATAVEKAMQIAKDKGLRKVIKLPVSAPFHCDLMAPAATAMAEALAKVQFADAKLPIICNVTAAAETAADTLKANLVTQVTGRVRWRESLITLGAAGATHLIEIGTGKVLSGLAKRSLSDVVIANFDAPDDLEGVLALV